MSKIDVDALLREIDPASPCGPNLEYDPQYVALEQAVLGKPEVQYGTTIIPAVPPDWKAVRLTASELIERSRDLRLAVILLRANLALFGVDGLADGVRLIERLLAERWDSVHPQLDADDGMDPLLRINSLAIFTDSDTILKDLKRAKLLMLPGLGPLSLRTLEIANGDLAPREGEEKVEPASIDLALADVDEEGIGCAVGMLSRVIDSVLNIENLLVRQVGSSHALNLDALTRPLIRGRDFLAQRLAARSRISASSSVLDALTPSNMKPVAASAFGMAGSPQPTPGGSISNRADVVNTLDKLIRYYAEYEPSSPVPLLLERAKRLVPKTFFEIMQDLAPEGIAQLLVIKGPDGAPQE